MKLRMTSGLSRSVARWMWQVTVSLGATLSATLIWSAIPHPSAPGPELTSGGKFAARAIQPVAYDGLDTMPLPAIASPPARFATVATDAVERLPPPAILHRASFDEAAPLVLAPERPARAAHAARPPLRAEARHVEPAPRGAAAAAPVALAAASEPAPEAKDDEGFLHRVIPSALPRLLPVLVSTARDAWTVTASAGDTLVARVVPRLP